MAGQHPTDLPSLRGSNNTPPNNTVFTNQFRSLFPKLTITDPEEAKELAQTASMGLPNKERVPEYRLDDQPNSQAPIPITVTDPKNVKWLRRATSSGVDPDQVISTFRQMQQLNIVEPLTLTITDPKNVKWLRQAKSSGIDPDQVISTFLQMQQFKQILKISSNL